MEFEKWVNRLLENESYRVIYNILNTEKSNERIELIKQKLVEYDIHPYLINQYGGKRMV